MTALQPNQSKPCWCWRWPPAAQALILQGQVKVQADKDVAAYEAEWRQLTHIVEQDRRDREAQRERELAAREERMAQLFQQEFRAGDKARSAGRQASGTAAAEEEAVSTATSGPERIKQLKAALAQVLEATGGQKQVCLGTRSTSLRSLLQADIPTAVSRSRPQAWRMLTSCLPRWRTARRPPSPCSTM